MSTSRHLTIAACALLAAWVPGSAAADPGKRESGHGRGAYKYEEKYERGGIKREWRSGNCKYEYKADRKGVKEEYKCRGRPDHVAPAYWIPPGHRGRGTYTSYGPPPLDLGAGRCNREIIGQILGGAGGAVLGSQIGDGTGRIVAIVGGTLAGFILGGEIGRSMDRADQLCVDQALEFAPDGHSVAWSDPAGGGGYTVVPRQTFEARDGRYCREYTAASKVGGQTAQTYGTACRQPDGSWQIVN